MIELKINTDEVARRVTTPEDSVTSLSPLGGNHFNSETHCAFGSRHVGKLQAFEGFEQPVGRAPYRNFPQRIEL